MYEFWYDYVNLKHREKSNLCYMGTDSFLVHIKTEGIYSDFSKEVKAKFDTSNYKLDRRNRV